MVWIKAPIISSLPLIHFIRLHTWLSVVEQ